MKDLISIIMPYWRFNSESVKFLDKALDSVKRQTIPSSSYEVLLGLDCPTDITNREVEKLVPKYEQSCNLKVYKRAADSPNISSTRNFLIPEAKGNWFSFLDADNTWSGNWLDIMLTAGKTIYPDVGYCKALGKVVKLPSTPSFDRSYFEHYLHVPVAPLFGQVFLSRMHLEKVGGEFDPRLRMWETSLMVVKLFYHFGFQYIQDAELFCREWAGAISSSVRTPAEEKHEWLSLFRKIAREWWEAQT